MKLTLCPCMCWHLVVSCTDAPTVGSASSGAGTSSAAPISDDLDIFGPMVSNPLPSNSNTSQVHETTNADNICQLYNRLCVYVFAQTRNTCSQSCCCVIQTISQCMQCDLHLYFYLYSSNASVILEKGSVQNLREIFFPLYFAIYGDKMRYI